MSNHIHLQIKDEQDKISKIMQSLQVRYVNYFNKKYNRVGHLFQDKFQSRCVENDSYNFNLLRYIHQNPVKAGISKIDKYAWSSYLEYIEDNKEILVDKKEILNLFSKYKEEAIKNFIEFNNEILNLEDSNEIIEYEIKNMLNDSEVIECIKRKVKIDNIKEIQSYDKKKRNQYLRKIKQINGCTQNQLSRILGINLRIIQRA